MSVCCVCVCARMYACVYVSECVCMCDQSVIQTKAVGSKTL